MTNNHHPHDKGFKLLFKTKSVFLAFLREFAHGAYADLITVESLELDDASFLTKDTDKLESDILYKAKIGEQEIFFFILMEMQSSQDYRMPLRLLQYQTEIWRRYDRDYYNGKGKKNYKLPIIQPILLYNGINEWNVPQTFHEILDGIDHYPAKDYVLNFKYDLVDVNRLEIADLMEHKSLISRVFLVEKNDSKEKLLDELQYNSEVVFQKLEDVQLFRQWMEYSAVEELTDEISEWITALELGGTAMIKSNINRIFENDKREKEQIAMQSELKGKLEGKLEAAQNLLDILDDETIAVKLGLLLADVQALRMKTLH